jgi:MFS family permease
MATATSPLVLDGTPRSAPPLMFATLALGAATFSALQSLLGPALPVMQRELGTTPSGIAWAMTAWLLAAAVATPILGRTGDLIGRRRALLIVLGTVVVGSVISAFAPNLPVMLLGRVLQGLGASVSPLAFGIIRAEYPRERVPGAIGIMSAVLAAGGGLGTVLAGPIVDAFGWRGLFWLPAAVLVLTAVLVVLRVPESLSRSGGTINVAAAALLGSWLVALLLPLSQGPAWGWGTPLVIGLFVLAAVLIVCWVRVEVRSEHPLIDMRIMRTPVVWRTNLIALLLGASQFAALTFVPQMLQTPRSSGYGLGLTVTAAGFVMLPILVAMTLGGIASGPLLRMVGLRAQLFAGAVLITIGAAGFAGLHSGIGWLAGDGLLFGLGLGLGFASMTSLIVGNVPGHQTGAATGVVSNSRVIGGAIGTAIFSSIVSASTHGGGYASEGGYVVGFIVLAGATLVAAVIAVSEPRHSRTAQDA